jgi:hypothetical protein
VSLSSRSCGTGGSSRAETNIPAPKTPSTPTTAALKRDTSRANLSFIHSPSPVWGHAIRAGCEPGRQRQRGKMACRSRRTTLAVAMSRSRAAPVIA